ncbi:hypothetical protein KIH27_00605 [Mycobacterium sp. M1]|uniref:Uncharacterized protein n=1 Tax=Mycolicibacter acidiphilus TaxID=2835306 RepID=A0ABS5RCS0_9MYCO|nr:hypothetical protein [Mycolicibacter acidiphilus]MBS9532082.1 hypothetical protein [Mycolicibacter acidiphilus]
MPAEQTATMIVWPKDCGHGGAVLELVEHFRPYWLGRRAGRRVSAVLLASENALATGLSLADSDTGEGFAEWTGRRVTVLRYPGCVLTDAEVDRAREAGVDVEVVEIAAGADSDGHRS